MSVLAHEGQSLHSIGDGILHTITGVDHLLSLLVIGVLAAFAIVIARRSTRSKS